MKNIEKSFKIPLTNWERYGRISRQGKNGRLVKRLRHQPLTLKTWVRFPYRSPQNEALHLECFFHSVVAGTFRLHSREHKVWIIAMFFTALFFADPRELGSKHCSAVSCGDLAGRSKFPSAPPKKAGVSFGTPAFYFLLALWYNAWLSTRAVL